jgi:hypothetical protein
MSAPFPTFYPPAKRRVIPAGANDPVIRPVVVSFHVAATLATSLFLFFRDRSGGIESHLYLLKDGTWEQYRAFDREADAQLGGNSWIARGMRLGSITVEAQGLGLGFYTKAQRRELKKFALWCNHELGIPLQVVTRPNPRSILEGGFGYHSLFQEWNTLRKSCPGPRRIAWFRNKFVPWMAEQAKVYRNWAAGDSLTDFAAKHDVSVARLWRLNRDVPKAGERVRIR